ncbi:MAG: hypothetical protein JSW46_16230 [Gemmatimonadota bacterium]|nr:MAG: hypothetical protein JSW46_16230 [Gemmatimonadota bacterium]
MIVTIPEVLRDKLGADGAEALAQLLNQSALSMQDATLSLAEERFERRLADELGKFRAEMWSAMGSLETRVTERMAGLETRLLRWAFAFWVGQFAVLLGILFAFFRT